MKSLIFLLILLFISIISFILEKKKESYAIYFIIAWMSLITIIIFISIIMPIMRYNYNLDIAAYKSFANIVNNIEIKDINDVGKAALIMKIAEWNEFVVKGQYENSTVLDWCVPDEIMELEIIK